MSLSKRHLIKGCSITDDEEEVLIIMWQAEALGITPDFENPEYRRYKIVAMRMTIRGHLVKRGGKGKDRYFYLTEKGEWLGEFLFDLYGLQFGDLIPKRSGR